MARSRRRSQSVSSPALAKGKASVPLYTPQDAQRPAQIADRADLSPEKYRSDFRRDYARLIHCPAFRRLHGKAQLFPCQENDFFRNRLSHSLEVGQIAKSIAIRLNDINPYFAKNNINTDLVEFAGLAHDIGHPPFGHNGESELDHQMLEYGGFKGNAQTLRILSRLEKKQTAHYPHEQVIPKQVIDRLDQRAGLNLTYRSLASVLKYDREIPRNLDSRKRTKSEQEPAKGYYYLENDLVNKIRAHVVGPKFKGQLKTIECSIMDIADDIAYSTYDMEDAFKGGFLNPLSIISMPIEIKSKIVKKIQDKLNILYSALPAREQTFTNADYDGTLRRVFSGVLNVDVINLLPRGEVDIDRYNALLISMTAAISEQLCSNGYYRTEFTSELVGRFVRAVDVEVNERFAAASEAKLSVEAFVAVELLKTLSFEAVIMSSRLKSAENRGQWIVEQIFRELTDDEGYLLMPEDWRILIDANADDSAWKRRTICDYIAGMTDAYCTEFYERILGRAAPSIQKQH